MTPHLLYVTHSAGFVHPVLPHSVEVLEGLAASTGAFTMEHFEDVDAALAQDKLAAAQGLVFYTSGELPLDDAARQRLLDFVAAGNAFVGFHSASDTLYEWSAYGALVGGYFNGHPWHEEVGLVIEEPAHPALSGLVAPVTLTDEIYQFSDWQQGSTVLLSLDTGTVDLGAGGVQQEAWGFPLAWTRAHGRGRVFYTALGHGDVWDDAAFQALALGGIRWATGTE
ncbi:MAG: ThuA domain-containing protein [Polyangiaceae bacterium]